MSFSLLETRPFESRWIRFRMLCGIVSIALISASPLAADSVELASGKKFEKITSVKATWESVEFRVRRKKQSFPAEQIAVLERDSEYLSDVRAQMARSAFKKAVEAIEDLDPETDKPQAWEVAEADYLLGEAHRRAGSDEDALNAFKAYTESHRESKDWWMPHAVSRLADLTLKAKQPGTATKFYKDLESFGETWAPTAKLGQGKAELAKGRSGAQEARKLFAEVVRLSRDPFVKQEARVLRIDAIFLTEQYGQVVKDLKAGFFDSPKIGEFVYGPARAKAALLMGKAYSAMGGAENLQNAEIWLQKVEALYRQEKEIHRDACEEMAKVLEKLGDAARAQIWKDKIKG